MQLFLFLFPLQQMKRPALQNEQDVVLRMAFRVRKVLGTFEKRALGQSFSPSLCGPNSYTRVDHWVKLHSSVRPWLPDDLYPGSDVLYPTI